jgi:tellurite resistance protein TerC
MATTDADSSTFVDLDVTIWAWVALAALLVVMLGIDLIRHREAHAPTTREALIESAIWVACGITFGVVLAFIWGTRAFGEYLSGYLIEKSLSIDNVFVWSMLFTTLAIPIMYQHRVLFWGIFGALSLRAVLILAGSALLDAFWWLLLLFGAFLVFTGIKVMRHRADDQGAHSSPGLRLLKRVVPVSDELHGQHFLTRVNGRRAATPLLAALVVIEGTDVVFAVDSVPAILAVSDEPYLVFASNAFAILGMRAMYFLLADAKERFHHLSLALGGILIFVGTKMAVSHWYHLNTYVSLAVIGLMLLAAVLLSMRRTRRIEAARATSETSTSELARSELG